MDKLTLIMAVFLALALGLILYNEYQKPKKTPAVEQDVEVTLVYSPKCPHCVKFKPVWHQVKDKCKDKKVKFREINAKEDPSNPVLPYVQGFPTVLVADPKKNILEKHVGFADEQVFGEFIARFVL